MTIPLFILALLFLLLTLLTLISLVTDSDDSIVVLGSMCLTVGVVMSVLAIVQFGQGGG